MELLLIQKIFVYYVQISSLAVENQILVVKLQQNKHPSVASGHYSAEDSKGFSFAKHDLTDVTRARETKEEATELLATGFEVSVPVYVYTS